MIHVVHCQLEHGPRWDSGTFYELNLNAIKIVIIISFNQLWTILYILLNNIFIIDKWFEVLFYEWDF